MDILICLVILIQMFLTTISLIDLSIGYIELDMCLSIIFFWPLYLIKYLCQSFLLIFKSEEL